MWGKWADLNYSENTKGIIAGRRSSKNQGGREAIGARWRGGEEAREARARGTRRKVEQGEVQDMRRGQQIIGQKMITSISQDACWKVKLKDIRRAVVRTALDSESRSCVLVPDPSLTGEVGQIPPLLWAWNQRGWPEWLGAPAFQAVILINLSIYWTCNVPGTEPSEREVYRWGIWGQGHSSGKWHSSRSLSWIGTQESELGSHQTVNHCTCPLRGCLLIEILIPALYHSKILYSCRFDGLNNTSTG